MTEHGTRAALYIRVSSKQQEDGTSLETQEARARQYAMERGFSIAETHVYRETYTGELLWERPALTRLREAIRQRDIDVVVAYAIDRLSRDPVHLGVILSEADHRGVAIEFVTESLDDSPEGQLILYVRGYAAKVEHEKIKERTMRGKIARVKAGKLLTNGKPLYGYHFRDDTKATLEINEPEAHIVRRIFAGIIDGETIMGLAARLTAERVPTPSGRSPRWAPATIQRLLHNPAYRGDAYGWGWRQADTKGNGRRSQWFDWERAIQLPSGVVPAIVDADTWWAAQAALQRNRQQATRNAREPEAALLRGGYVRCAYCGGSMVARERTNKSGYEYYCRAAGNGVLSTCDNGPSIAASILDHAVWCAVKQALTDDAVIDQALAQARVLTTKPANSIPYDKLIAELGKQQTALARRIAIIDDDLLAEPLIAELRQVTERRRQLTTEQASAAEESRKWECAQENLQQLRMWRRQWGENLDALSWADKRTVLDLLGIKVVVRRKRDTGRRFEIGGVVNLNTSSVTTTTCGDGHTARVPLHWGPHDIAKRWALHHLKCIRCGSDQRPHKAHGMCTRCYRRQWSAMRKG